MNKFFLLSMLMSTLLLADYMTESELLINQNLEDIKNKYHIQDETTLEPVTTDTSILQIKQELQRSDASMLIKKPARVETITPKIKQNLPSPNEPVVSNKEDKLERIRRELNIKELSPREKKLDKIRHELDINYKAPKKESFLDKSVSSVKETLHMEGEIEGEYSFSNTVSDLKKTLHLDVGSSFGLPSFGLSSLFGEEKKKKKDNGLFGIGILGDVQDTGTSIYKGMKYSGQSAELMSGMMYNSSKMYNTMFGMFDDSPLNIFEEEEETSMFDFIEGGNSIMELFN